MDSLRNIVRDPQVGLIFLIPNVGETIRVRGRAELLVDEDLCASFAINGKPASCVLSITVDRIYYQCQKALVRAHLWKAEAQVPRSALPSAGQMLEAVADEPFDGEEYDRGYPEHLKKTIY